LFFYSRRTILFSLERKFEFIVSGIVMQRLGWGLGISSLAQQLPLKWRVQKEIYISKSLVCRVVFRFIVLQVNK